MAAVDRSPLAPHPQGSPKDHPFIKGRPQAGWRHGALHRQTTLVSEVAPDCHLMRPMPPEVPHGHTSQLGPSGASGQPAVAATGL